MAKKKTVEGSGKARGGSVRASGSAALGDGALGSGAMGDGALLALRDRLARLPRAEIQPPRTDVQAAATWTLGLARKLQKKALRDRFASLPAAEFDVRHLDGLLLGAQAVLAAQLAFSQAEVGRSEAKVPLSLAQGAAALRERMLTLLDYYFADDAALGPELRDIRQGAGYLDLASDLSRLAAIYKSHKPLIGKDVRHYQSGDAAAAAQAAAAIHEALGESQGGKAGRGQTRDSVARDTLWRAWAFLQQTYVEVAAAGRFLLRAEGGDAMFPALNATGRTPARRPKKARPPAPPSE